MSRAVIDQPGLKIVITGLVVSFALGLWLRWEISEVQLQKHINKLKAQIQEDFIFDYESTQIQLSQWGLPIPSLKVYKIRLSPKKNSCQNSQIFMSEIEIPLSPSAMIFSDSLVESLRAKEVQVRISSLKDCLISETKKIRPNKESVVNGKDLVKSTDLLKKVESEADKTSKLTEAIDQPLHNSFKNIYIEQLKLILIQRPEQSILFKNINLDLSYQGVKIDQIDLHANVLAAKDLKNESYLLHADLHSALKINDHKNIEASMNLSGRMLDGDFKFFGYTQSLNQKLMFELNLNHTSLKAFTPFFEDLKVDSIFEKWPLVASFDLFGELSLAGDNSDYNIKASRVELKGEDTLVSIPQLEIAKKNDQLQISKADAFIDKLPLKYLNKYFENTGILQSVENFGFISGKAQLVSAEKWIFNGILQDFEFIFSNQGHREYQKINSTKIKIEQNSNNINLSLFDLNMNNADLDGQYDLSYNLSDKSFQSDLDIQGVIINEKVWKLLTDSVQAPNIKVIWNAKKRLDQEKHQLHVFIPKIEVKGLRVQQAQVDFIQSIEAKNKSLVLNLKAKDFILNSISFLNQEDFKKIISDLNWKSEKIAGDHLNIDLHGSHWRKMFFNLEALVYSAEDEEEKAKNLKQFSREHFNAKGEWHNEELRSLLIFDNKLNKHSYKIFKTKDEPIRLEVEN